MRGAGAWEAIQEGYAGQRSPSRRRAKGTEMFDYVRRWIAFCRDTQGSTKPLSKAWTVRPLCVEPLEDRRLLACIASDSFLCTPLPNGHNGLEVHIHPHLTIIINGQQQTIPANTNILL